jgi:hypothetical protein
MRKLHDFLSFCSLVQGKAVSRGSKLQIYCNGIEILQELESTLQIKKDICLRIMNL